jgi:hypothetical protein
MHGRDNKCKDVIPEGRMDRTGNAVQNIYFYYKNITCFFLIKLLHVTPILSHHQHYKTRQI